MRDAVVVEAVRTAVGKRRGRLAGVHPVDLSAHVLDALARRTGLDPGVVDDVLWGCFSQVGPQALNTGRNAVLAAGWPESVPGATIDRQCGSSQQAIAFAAAGLVAGHHDVVVAGGVESMSQVPMLSSIGADDPYGARYATRYPGIGPDQGVAAELVAQRWGLSRAELDEFARRSHARALAARDAGLFAAEIAPLPVGDAVVEHDQGPRPGVTAERLASLQPAFRADGVVTAGNAAQTGDAAAALLLTTSDAARELGLTPFARVHTCAVAAVDPITMLTAPIPATEKVLRRAGLALSDIGAVEVNEAFASVVLAWLAATGAAEDLVNPLGGAIALGHPLGASGARLATTLLHHMRRSGIRYGLQVMCEGGGQSNATVYELLRG